MNPLQLVALLGAIAGSAAGYEFAEPLAAQEFSISSQIVDAIEEIKQQMPCGFPDLGVPPLDPLQVPQQDVNLTTGNMSLNGTVENLHMDGLRDFDIVDFGLNLLRSKINYDFVWKNIHLKTLYDLLFKNNENNLDTQLHRNGLADIAVKGLRIWGEIKYSISLIGNRLKVKEFKVFVSIDQVISDIEGLSSDELENRRLNDNIERWIKSTINENTKRIGELSNKYVVPILNNAIGGRSLRELIDAIGGGKGGPTVPKEPCNPLKAEHF